ncbi:peroxisome membrane anchor protein Pex14p [Cunninghamella echinulata]|nr:peroxisome membrane anchor protein Pex14p [Cunninghamella echinulata]
MSTDTQLREDLLKLAINFLSSPKVQSADKEKKITFLKSKGLTDAEITEAFKRNDQQNTTTTTTTTTNSTSSDNNVSTSLSTSPSTATSSASSSINYNPPPTSLIPEKPLEPLIIYQPAPEPEKVPTSQVLAMSIIFGIGMTGIASTFIGIVKVK